MVVVHIAVLSALAALSNAAPSQLKHVVHEMREKPSTDWTKSARIEPSAILPVRIGLSQSNLEMGNEFLSGLLTYRFGNNCANIYVSSGCVGLH